MSVAAALLDGNGDFARSVCIAVQAGFDTDCNGATVGSVVGMWKGVGAIPAEWLRPVNGRLKTQILGREEVSVDRLVDTTLAHMCR